MCLAQGPQRSDAGEARTRGPSVSSQGLYHCAPRMHFERIKHRIVIVLASEYTLLSYLNVSSVIPQGKHHFYPANRFWETRKSLFIAKPRSDFNRCYEQRILENNN